MASSKGPEFSGSAVPKSKNLISGFNTDRLLKRYGAFDMWKTKSVFDTHLHDSGRPAMQNPFGSALMGSEFPESAVP